MSWEPARRDTASWDAKAAGRFLAGMAGALAELPPTAEMPLQLAHNARAQQVRPACWLLRLPDHQRLLLVSSEKAAGFPEARQVGTVGAWVALAVTGATISQALPPASPWRPRALGPVPRLGLGSRTTVLSWPSVYGVLAERSLYANAIQNSVARELIPQRALTDGGLGETFLPGVGSVPVGHTGSTIEGLWLEGVLSAIEAQYRGPGFGADADHVPMHRGDVLPELLSSSLRYTFFTLDIGQLVSWREEGEKRWLRALPVLAETAAGLARTHPAGCDLEVALDESPPEIPALEAATTPDQLRRFLTLMDREGIRLSYVGVHPGFTKGEDLPLDDPGLEPRLGELHAIAEGAGVLLDIHSGDALTPRARRLLARACRGRLAFKVAPIFQQLLAEAMAEAGDPALEVWWQRARAELAGWGKGMPRSPVDVSDPLFGEWSFLAFRHPETRSALYSLSDETRGFFAAKLRRFIESLADDLELAPVPVS